MLRGPNDRERERDKGESDGKGRESVEIVKMEKKHQERMRGSCLRELPSGEREGS